MENIKKLIIIKKSKLIFILCIISLLFVLSACTDNNKKNSFATSNTLKATTTEMPKSTTPTVAPTVTPTPNNDTNQVNTKYGFNNDLEAPYKQYINNLKYLDENDKKSMSYYIDINAKMVETTHKSLNNWDKELNKIYSLLINKLPSKDAKKLKVEEQTWKKERDQSVAKFLTKSKKDYEKSINHNYWLYYATKNRTLELIHRYFKHDLDKGSAMEAYRAILRNDAKFFCIDDTNNNNNKDEYLKDYFHDDLESPQLYLHFAVVDMDCDGVPEVVVELYDEYDDGESESGIVLHYEDGTVYGYQYGAGEINELKKDGSYSYTYADGIGDAKIQFWGIINNYVYLSFNDGNYLINNKPTTEEKFNNFSNAQKQKENVNWFSLNSDNIKSQVFNS